MDLIDPVIQEYDWGSRTLIARLLHEEYPTEQPQAELWFGAHPAAPSTVDGVAFDTFLAADPVGQLGEAGELPFLLKVLAAGGPLSLQAHPSEDQAVRGFAAENAAGIPLDAPDRNYRDPNHKPELIVALTEFHALAGFREVSRTRELLRALAVPALLEDTAALNDESGLREVLTGWLTMPSDQIAERVDQIRDACDRGLPGWMEPVARTTADLARRYPGDPGVLASVLLNRVTLQPGQALFLGAGHMHAYLSGLGVEIMASSDNVLRGGLTSKHVDVPKLLEVLTFESEPDPILDPEPVDGVTSYPAPVDEFALSSVTLGGEGREIHGPAMVLVTEGTALVDGSSLDRGRAAWIPANRPATVSGRDSATVFVATVPRD